MARQTEAIRKLIDQDLDRLTPLNASWHSQYSGSAYVYIGNLDPRLTEGDIITIFSQFGDVVDINLGRDKETGKSLGFCFLAFENQRSTVLAIDNMVGFSVLGKPLRIDHVLDYKPPKRYSEFEKDEDGLPVRIPYEATGAEGKGVGVYNVTESQRRLNKQLMVIKASTSKKLEKEDLDEDELWALKFDQSIKDEQPQRLKEEPL